MGEAVAVDHAPAAQVLLGGTALLLALAAPALALRVTPGSFEGIPRAPESSQGLELLRDGVGSGAVTPTHVVIDGGARSRPAIERLANGLARDPEVHIVARGRRPPYVDDRRRFSRVIVVGRHEYGEPETRALVHRLRDRLVPAAGFPAGTTVVAGGAPSQGADFLSATYDAFPWLVLAVLGVTFVVLVVAFRSLVLPLKAVLLNALTVAAVYGVLVLVCQWGVGAGSLGLEQTGAVEGWIPSSSSRRSSGCRWTTRSSSWRGCARRGSETGDNARAVAEGLEQTGAVITAAALIMVAAFAGFVAGRVSGLEQLGLGLALGVLIDATIVRALLVPAFMAVFGRWNWWLPRGDAHGASPGERDYATTLIASRIAGSWYPSARPGASCAIASARGTIPYGVFAIRRLLRVQQRVHVDQVRARRAGGDQVHHDVAVAS